MGSVIVVAGAAGTLGGRIVKALVERGADVRALVRPGTSADRIAKLEVVGATVMQVDLNDVATVTASCQGATCVVSALLGLREVMVDTQTSLLNGAIAAGVPKFIPSDYAMDFMKTEPGTNRNLDLHREFAQIADGVAGHASIRVTSILNGAFMSLLTGEAPIILFKLHRVLYWGNADQVFDFTTMDDTAAYTAAAALDPDTPRWLRIAGQQVTARQLAGDMFRLTGEKYGLLRPGGLGLLKSMIKIARTLQPAPDEPFPAWQGMQYLYNMSEGSGVLTPLDNDRYPDIRWDQMEDVVGPFLQANNKA